MSINKIIIDALATLDVPVAFMAYTGTENKYITFFKYNEQGTLRADDKERRLRHSIQVDVWGDGDIEALTQQMKTKLQAIGFERVGYFEDYEQETKTYHKAYRFYYEEAI